MSSAVEKATYEFGDLTAGAPAKLELSFKAILVDTPAKEEKQYVSVGVLYDNEQFLWVAHTEIETSINTTVEYPVDVKNTQVPSPLNKGETELIEVEVFVTNPSADLIFSFFNPLGFGDVFNLGTPKLTVGASFGCNNPDNWKLATSPSISRKSIGKVEYKYEGLINTDESHDVSNDANKIVITVPITAMDEEDAPGQYAFTVGVQVGTVDVITVTRDIIVTDDTHTKSPQSGQTSGAISLINDGQVYPGSAALFELSITVPKEVTFDLQLSFDNWDELAPAQAIIKDAGMCGGFDRLQISNPAQSFGVIKNFDTGSPTTVVVHIAMQVVDTAQDGDTLTMKVEVDGKEYTTSVGVTATPSQLSLKGVGSNLGFDILNTGFETGIKSEIIIPSTMIGKDITFEVFPDLDVTDFDLRLCRLEVERIGTGLPCIAKASDGTSASISKSSDTRLFDDHGIINLGTTCPAGLSDLDSTLSISFIYQLPPQDTIKDSTEITVNGGLYLKDSSLWVTSNTVTTATAAHASLESWEPGYNNTKAYIGVRKNEADVPLGNPFYLRYVIKTQPKTRGKMEFKVLTYAGISVCQLKVLKIGRNMACAQKPEGYTDKYLQTDLAYSDQFKVSSYATLTFDGLTNFGETEMEPNLYADDNTIEIGAFFRFTDPSASTIDATFTGADKRIARITPSDTTQDDKNDPGLDFTWVTVNEGEEGMFMSLPRILGISVTVPSEFKWPTVKIQFADKDFSKKIQFCGVHVTKQGLNVPCIDFATLPTFPNDSSLIEVDDLGNAINYKEIYLDLSVCHYPMSKDPEESKFQVEITFKATDAAADGDVITLEASVDGGSTTKETSIIMAAVQPDFVTISNTTYATIEENTTVIEAGPGEKVWVSFDILVPRATIPLELAAMTPSVDGKAVMTIEGIRFAESGINICCTGSMVDPNKVYKPKFEKNENTTSFMQKDSLLIDLGIVTNGGYTFRRGFNREDDDKFRVEIMIRMSDHPVTEAGAKFPVRLAANSGDVISVGSREVTVKRVTSTDRWEKERPAILIKMNLTDPDTIFKKGDKIEITAVVYHSDISTGEGSVDNDNIVRLILPPWLDYVFGEDTCLTNYTADNLCVERNNSQGRPDFLFPNGINFPDIISMNFTLSVDTYNRLGVGRGDVPSMAVSQVVCFPATFGSWPDNYEMCGPYQGVKIVVASPECYDPIIVEPCRVSASSAMDENTKPENVLNDDDTFWAPAVRTGAGWKHFLQFFLGRKTRLNRIEIIGADTDKSRMPTGLTLEVGNDGVSWRKVALTGAISGEMDLEKAEEIKYIKLNFEENPDDDNIETLPLGIKTVKLYGCAREDTLVNCTEDTTRISSDRRQYRHIAFDPLMEIFYFCDVNPRKEGLHCYANQAGTSKFVELPQYVDYIKGYSTSAKLMFLSDKSGGTLASKDGVRMTLMPSSFVMPGDIEDATVVPGFGKDMPAVELAGGYKADFYGVEYNGKKVITWSACCVP